MSGERQNEGGGGDSGSGRLRPAPARYDLVLLAHLALERSACISNSSDECPDGAVGALITQDTDEGLDKEQEGFETKVALDAKVLHLRDRVFKADGEDSEEHHEDLDERDCDDYCCEGLCCWGQVVTAAVEDASHKAPVWDGRIRVDDGDAGAANEVPEELAVEEAPETGPDEVDTSADSDKAGPLVPDEFAHADDWMLGMKYVSVVGEVARRSATR